MELRRTIKKKIVSSKEKSMDLESRSVIRVKDFDNELYIAVNGVPLLPIDSNWTASQIIDRLNDLRDGYMTYRIKNNQSYLSLKDYVDRDKSEDQ